MMRQTFSIPPVAEKVFKVKSKILCNATGL